ncbi:uncharacterized oxidoreductase YjmC-like [Hetaerina americana]|uniref:uncharacterized oxidoreductase YjmC-like n=1 Tax=Hetaerina americana TaxID=62018 RepID=UPI003A7F26F0
MAAKKLFAPLPEICRFVTDVMTAVGTPAEHAYAMSELLVAADYRGHLSHGLNRLSMYVEDVRNGTTDPCATPEVIKEKSAVALVDGKNGLGPVVGNFCMDLAMEKAKETGVGWISARGTNHYGIAGWYSMRAANQGFVGITCSNTSPVTAPLRSKKAAVGTNPISVAAPAKNDSFVLDMATSTAALGKIELKRSRNEDIPLGWAQDIDGNMTTNPDKALLANCLMPLGGAEETSGYKGTGIALMVDIFSGILSGANYGPFIRNWKNASEKANLGQCFIALDPSAFAPCFEERLSNFLDVIRALEPVDPNKPVLVAGDPEKIHMKEVSYRGGILYHQGLIDAMSKLAEELNICPLRSTVVGTC